MSDDARTEADREALRKLFGLKLGPPAKKLSTPEVAVVPAKGGAKRHSLTFLAHLPNHNSPLAPPQQRVCFC
jgi:hypothetical protein